MKGSVKLIGKKRFTPEYDVTLLLFYCRTIFLEEAITTMLLIKVCSIEFFLKDTITRLTTRRTFLILYISFSLPQIYHHYFFPSPYQVSRNQVYPYGFSLAGYLFGVIGAINQSGYSLLFYR